MIYPLETPGGPGLWVTAHLRLWAHNALGCKTCVYLIGLRRTQADGPLRPGHTFELVMKRDGKEPNGMKVALRVLDGSARLWAAQLCGADTAAPGPQPASWAALLQIRVLLCLPLRPQVPLFLPSLAASSLFTDRNVRFSPGLKKEPFLLLAVRAQAAGLSFSSLSLPDNAQGSCPLVPNFSRSRPASHETAPSPALAVLPFLPSQPRRPYPSLLARFGLFWNSLPLCPPFRFSSADPVNSSSKPLAVTSQAVALRAHVVTCRRLSSISAASAR